MSRRMLVTVLIALGGLLTLPQSLVAQDESFTRTSDVIYGRKHGMALTMDVFEPKNNRNGAGIILVVSGGWRSAHESIHPLFVQPMLDRGYTVFAVVHGSQPKFTIIDIIPDIHRAVRYIRHHAARWQVDPQRLGIYGGSAGGHLSLMIGTSGKDGDPNAKDSIDRQSSSVQAVACLFPPTDFLNYGETGHVMMGTGTLAAFYAPFDFHEYDAKRRAYVPITDEARRLEIGREISPVYHVDSGDAPTLIVHGDADKLVPIQQAELIMAAFEKAGVESKLIVKPGAGHGWRDMAGDLSSMVDWFDQYLLK